MKKIISFSIFIIGFTAMTAQIVLMREFFSVFHGNEMTIACLLAVWLVCGAFGSWVLGNLRRRTINAVALFSYTQLCASVLLPMSVLAVRYIRVVLKIPTGEMIPYTTMMWSGFLILLPVCALLGLLFSLGCTLLAPDKGDTGLTTHTTTNVGKTYILDVLGSMMGGLITSFLLIRILPSLHIMVVLAILNALCVFAVQQRTLQNRVSRMLLRVCAVCCVVGGITGFAAGTYDMLHKKSLAAQWKDTYTLVASQTSIYGNIALVQRYNQYSLFNNGVRVCTVPDIFSAEEAAHYPLLEHSLPRTVLLIGGGMGGVVDEILKHPTVETIDYVELDPAMIQLAHTSLPPEYRQWMDNPRVRIHNLDGRRFVKLTRNRFDCVLILVGDPITANINRYYTVEFFREIQQRLNPNGIVSCALMSSENFIGPQLKTILQCVYRTMQSVFPDVKVLPGGTAHFCASNTRGILTDDYTVLMQRVKERDLSLQYVREYFLRANLSAEKIGYITRILNEDHDAVRAVRLNRDTKPAAYYDTIVFWMTYFKHTFMVKILNGFAQTPARILSVFFGICAVCCGFLFARREKTALIDRRIVLLVMGITGCAEMAFQIIVLFAFQMLYGYVFHQLGLLLTSFMIGLPLGSWHALHLTASRENSTRTYCVRTLFGISIYALLLPVVITLLSHANSGMMQSIGAYCVFPFVSICAGYCGGLLFPLANALLVGKKENSGGMLYGVDLIGACVGAVGTGVLFVPVLGITITCVVLGGICFVVWGIVLRCKHAVPTQ